MTLTLQCWHGCLCHHILEPRCDQDLTLMAFCDRDLWPPESNMSLAGAREYSLSVLSNSFKPFMRYRDNNIRLDERTGQPENIQCNAFADTIAWRRHKNIMKITDYGEMETSINRSLWIKIFKQRQRGPRIPQSDTDSKLQKFSDRPFLLQYSSLLTCIFYCACFWMVWICPEFMSTDQCINCISIVQWNNRLS